MAYSSLITSIILFFFIPKIDLSIVHQFAFLLLAISLLGYFIIKSLRQLQIKPLFLGLIALCACLYLQNTITIPTRTLPSKAGALSLLSYNLNYLRTILVPDSTDKHYSFQDFEDFYQTLLPIDFLCVQETSSASYVPISKILNYPYYYGRRGTMIFARQDFIEKGFLPFDEASDNSCTWVTIEYNNQLLRVYNLHLESYNFSKILDNLNQENNMVDKIRSFIQQVNQIGAIRKYQIQLLLAHQQKSPYPSIICGDFNELPLSNIYQEMKSHFQDAFIQSGTGFGQTYAHFLGLRIDYFFTSPTLNIHQFKTISTDFSDHYPIKIEITF